MFFLCSSDDYHTFSLCLAHIKYFSKQRYCNICQIKFSLSQNSREFWMFLRKNKLSLGIHSYVNLDDIPYTDASNTNNLYSKHFNLRFLISL